MVPYYYVMVVDGTVLSYIEIKVIISGDFIVDLILMPTDELFTSAVLKRRPIGRR